MIRFSDFPKTRPELPDEFEKIYKNQYKQNREGKTLFSSLSLKAESWQHIRAVKDILQDNNNKSTLEIGAGTLNHLPYEPANIEYDIIEPHKELYEASELLKHIRNVFSDISELPPHSKYHRIISFNVFEHICNLPEVVAKCGLLLEPDGHMKIGIPSEGTPVWSLSWRLTRGIEFRIKYGLDYNVLMKYEHVNTALEIGEVLMHFFSNTQVEVLGLCKSLSLYQLYTCATPNLNRCSEYLDHIKSIY